MNRRFARALLPGMTVGLVAPGSPVFEAQRCDAAAALMEEMGFRVRRGETMGAADFLYAGDPAFRARDLQRMFLDDGVDAVICLRGGYGCRKLLPLLDYAAIARHPKPFVGFSDVTLLHAAFIRKCGFLPVHGPMPALAEPIGLRDPAARRMWLDTLTGAAPRRLKNPDGTPFAGRGQRCAQGRLIGGNLSVLTTLLGTPYEPEWDGRLLLLEDVSERADRLITHLSLLEKAGVFRRIAGLVLGDFSRYHGMTTPSDAEIPPFILPFLPPELPVLYRVHAGHGRDRITLTLNARYRINPLRGSLTLCESPFRT